MSIHKRVVSISENRTTTEKHEPLELKKIEIEIEGMVSPILLSIPDKLFGFKSDIWIVVEPDEGYYYF